MERNYMLLLGTKRGILFCVIFQRRNFTKYNYLALCQLPQLSFSPKTQTPRNEDDKEKYCYHERQNCAKLKNEKLVLPAMSTLRYEELSHFLFFNGFLNLKKKISYLKSLSSLLSSLSVRRSEWVSTSFNERHLYESPLASRDTTV